MASLEIYQSIEKIGEEDWENARNTDYPFLSYAFLSALEQSDSVNKASGWIPFHIKITDEEGEENKVAYMPMYIKSHSYGEYVFDWAWADAFHRYNLEYYPKLVCAIPFTPATGPRALPIENEQWAFDLLTDAFPQMLEEFDLSSCHLLFPNQDFDANNPQFLRRVDTQFHWFNRNYETFDDFLDQLSSRHRKNMKKERAKVHAQGVVFETLSGDQITQPQLKQFYTFYHATYMKRGQRGYLTYEFFEQLLATLANQMLFVFAKVDDQPVAVALSFHDSSTLYGRYWGCLDEYDSLHFETCYYQGIDYCIQKGIKRFDPGAQGEHKIKRGFEPVETHSFHWIQEQGFIEPIQRFLAEEKEAILENRSRQKALLPYKTPS